ncbi:MAG: hypothetical protein IPF99_01015 [Deltaproteobacteria bacterium]|nr:hypothetical protein [Deltaproteobacteria bacterium]
MPRDCRELHTLNPSLPSGEYMVDLDGAGSGAATTVRCDMTTDGGGWTLVFDSGTTNFSQAGVPWTRADVAAALVTPGLATTTLVAYRDASFALLPSLFRVSFAMPAGWRTAAPLNVSSVDAPVMVSFDGGPPLLRRLRHGYGGFLDNCAGDWGVGGNFGRFCITPSPAPFYAAFGVGAADRCVTSDVSWNSGGSTNECGASRRFTLYIR